MDLTSFDRRDEFIVNSYTSGRQDDPQIAALPGGGFVVVWESYWNNSQVRGQVYDAGGAKLGSEFLVHAANAEQSESPAVTALASGDFVVSWETYRPDDKGAEIVAQLFSGAGSKIGAEISINTSSAGHQIDSTIAPLASGGFLVVWATVSGPAGRSGDLRAQLVNASGTKLGGEFEVDGAFKGQFADAARLASGNLVVTWTHVTIYEQPDPRQPTEFDIDIYARIVAPDGSLLTEPARVNATTSGWNFWTQVAPLASGGFVVVGEERKYSEAGRRGVHQVFDASGAKVGGELYLSPDGGVFDMRVTGHPDGGYVLSWKDGSGHKAQAYTDNGHPVGGAISVDVLGFESDVTALSDGSLVFVGHERRGEYDDIIAQYFTSPGVTEINGTGASETISGTAGRNIVRPGLGADTVTLGFSADTLEGTLQDLLGDRVTDLGFDDELHFLSSRFTKANLDVQRSGNVVNLVIDGDRDGSSDGSLTLDGTFTDGDFMVAGRSGGTIVSFEQFLTPLAEGARLSAGEINGVANADYLSGDTGSAFTIRLLPSQTAYNNSLGVYEVDGSGQIVDVRIIAADVKAVTGDITVSNIDPGHRLGFFIVQDGANRVDPAVLSSSNLSLIDQGGRLVLADNGSAVPGAVVFVSHDPSRNVDGMEHVTSGVAADGSGSLQLGFEDMLRTGSDDDFQDVVFQVSVFQDYLL